MYYYGYKLHAVCRISGVDIAWQGGSLVEAVISSGSGEPCNVRYGKETLTFPTQRGKTYTLQLDGGHLVVK